MHPGSVPEVVSASAVPASRRRAGRMLFTCFDWAIRATPASPGRPATRWWPSIAYNRAIPAEKTGRHVRRHRQGAGEQRRTGIHFAGTCVRITAVMMKLALVAGLSVAALAIGYWLLDKRPGYGAYYGIAKLTGARLDIGPVDFATLTRHATGNDALVCPPQRCPNAEADWEAKTYDMAPEELLERLTKIALAEPNMRALDRGTDHRHVGRFLQHSRVMGFPDTIDVEVFPVG